MAAAPLPLRSLRETRDFVRARGDLHGVRIEVHAADGIPAASAMAHVLRERSRNGGWDVPYLARLEEAADLDVPLTDARRSVSRLVRRLTRDLLCAVPDEEGDGEAEAAERQRHGVRLQRGRHGARGYRVAQGDGARLQRGRHGARQQRGLHGELGDHVAHVGVAFADGTGAASTTKDIDDLRDAEEKIRGTMSAPLQDRAAALADHMKDVRLLLRRFASRFSSLEGTWARSSRRRSREIFKTTFRRRFDPIQTQREAVLQRLRALDGDLLSFESSTVELA